MALATQPPWVKLVCGLLSADETLLDAAGGAMEKSFGPIDLVSETMDFDFTDYYEEEMGPGLKRRFVAFERLIRPDALAEAKEITNALECDFAARAGGGPSRPVNLDPGYVAAPKLILASMKNFAHRIYLGRGVYGEVTLMYHKGRWDALPWTFPDYASGRYHAFLTDVRDRLRQQETASR